MKIPDSERCTKQIHDSGRSVTFHRCLNRRVIGEFCAVHSPTAQMARRAARTQCAHVDEESGDRDCHTIVTGTKYCKWHGENVHRAWIYSRAKTQQDTLTWLESLDKRAGGRSVSIAAVIRKLKVELKNA